MKTIGRENYYEMNQDSKKEYIVKIQDVEHYFVHRNTALKPKIYCEGFLIHTNIQIIRLLIDQNLQFQEQFGSFVCNNNHKDLIGAQIHGISIVHGRLNKEYIDKYNEITEERNVVLNYIDPLEGDVRFVNIFLLGMETNMGDLDFVAYNAQNGFSGHDVIFDSNQVKRTIEI